MEVAVFAIVFVAIVEKILQRIYKDYRIITLVTVLCIGMLIVTLTIAIFEKISLLPVLLLLR